MAEVCFFILHNHPSLSSLYAIISWPYKPLRCHFKSVGLSEQQTRLKLKGDSLFEYKAHAVKLFSDYKNIVYAVFGLVFGSASFTQEFQSVLEKTRSGHCSKLRLSHIKFSVWFRKRCYWRGEAEYVMFICYHKFTWTITVKENTPSVCSNFFPSVSHALESYQVQLRWAFVFSCKKQMLHHL